MKEKLVETIKLANDQNLEIYDISRNIAAKTCLVCIIFKITIKINKIKFKINTDISDSNIMDKLGDEIIYEVKHERNFIKEDFKEAVFIELKDSFLNTNLKYLSHKDFAEKYILKKYNQF